MNTEITLKNGQKINPLQKANDCFEDLKPNFKKYLPGQYWVLGCTFDSIIDFLNLAPADIIPRQKSVEFLLDTTNIYLATLSQGVWYDDWCWWGNPAAKIFLADYSGLLNANPDLQNNLEKICTDTFLFVKTGVAPYMAKQWPNNIYYTGTTNAYSTVLKMAAQQNKDAADWATLASACAPVWNLGCWQGPMFPDSANKDPLPPQNPSPIISDDGHDPTNVTLGAFQDSVMNGLFYLFAIRTLNKKGAGSGGFPTNLGTPTDVSDMNAFYRYWMGEGQPSLLPQQQLFMQLAPHVDEALPMPGATLPSPAGLFRERVSIYSNNTAPEGFNVYLAWTGDQGLMLSALTELYNTQSGTAQQNTLTLITTIINGVFGYALGNIYNEGHGTALYTNVIMPWCNVDKPVDQQPGHAPGYSDDSYNHEDKHDYFSGTGIFMRGLLEASGIIAIMQMIKSNSNIQQVLRDTLSALMDNTVYADSILGGISTDEDILFDKFNRIATLIAAYKLLGS